MEDIEDSRRKGGIDLAVDRRQPDVSFLLAFCGNFGQKTVTLIACNIDLLFYDHIWIYGDNSVQRPLCRAGATHIFVFVFGKRF